MRCVLFISRCNGKGGKVINDGKEVLKLLDSSNEDDGKTAREAPVPFKEGETIWQDVQRADLQDELEERRLGRDCRYLNRKSVNIFLLMVAAVMCLLALYYSNALPWSEALKTENYPPDVRHLSQPAPLR